MYGLLWRSLPGPGWIRALILLAMLAAVIYISFELLFPQISDNMPFDDTTVGE
jgi:hypothetical protein